MPIPGVGFTEVAIILVAALLIFGPDKLPEIMGQAGRAMRDFRKMTGNLQGEFEKNLNDVAGTDVRKTLSSEIAGLKGEVQSATNAANGRPATKTTSTAAKSTTAGKATGTAAKSTATSTTKPSTTSTSRTTTPSTARTTTGTGSVVGSGTAKAATAAAPVVEESREIEFAPVVTSTRRRSSAATSPAPAVTIPASRPAATAPAASTAVADAGTDGDATDPFARARSRRQAAGYQR